MCLCAVCARLGRLCGTYSQVGRRPRWACPAPRGPCAWIMWCIQPMYMPCQEVGGQKALWRAGAAPRWCWHSNIRFDEAGMEKKK